MQTVTGKIRLVLRSNLGKSINLFYTLRWLYILYCVLLPCRWSPVINLFEFSSPCIADHRFLALSCTFFFYVKWFRFGFLCGVGPNPIWNKCSCKPLTHSTTKINVLLWCLFVTRVVVQGIELIDLLNVKVRFADTWVNEPGLNVFFFFFPSAYKSINGI